MIAVDRMSISRFVTLAVGALVLLAALGYVPTRRLAGDGATSAMLVGAGLALLASMIGILPLLKVRGRPPAQKIAALMGSIALRLGVVVAAAAAVALAGVLALKPFLVWIALSHLVLVAVDSLFARAEIRADDPTPNA